jgi:DNA-binding transcriptional ArsR family regulator
MAREREQRARRSETAGRGESRATRPAGAARARALPELDRIIHERMRLAIVSALAAEDRLSFHDLKSLLQASDGNLSVHARKLEEAGYVACEKSFEGRTPRTVFRLTADGRRAFERYLGHLEALVQTARSRS